MTVRVTAVLEYIKLIRGMVAKACSSELNARGNGRNQKYGYHVQVRLLRASLAWSLGPAEGVA